MEATRLGEPLAPNAGDDTSPTVSVAGGRFTPGHDPRRNTAGRIKKKPTIMDELQKQAESARHRRRIASAWVQTAERADTAAGQRAREALSDRLYGIPKQTLVLERGEDAGMAWLQQLASERQQLPPGEGADA